jgi:hypothetical protein
MPAGWPRQRFTRHASDKHSPTNSTNSITSTATRLAGRHSSFAGGIPRQSPRQHRVRAFGASMVCRADRFPDRASDHSRVTPRGHHQHPLHHHAQRILALPCQHDAGTKPEGSFPSGQRGQTVNLMDLSFAGSNPALPTPRNPVPSVSSRHPPPVSDVPPCLAEGRSSRRPLNGGRSGAGTRTAGGETREAIPTRETWKRDAETRNTMRRDARGEASDCE